MTPRLGRALLLSVALSAGQLYAADPDEQAREHYRRGAQAYDKGRYKDAVDAFSAADRLVPRPALSFNIARAYQRLGDDSAALAHYRDYLRRAPQAPDRDEVEKRVVELSAVLQKKGVQQVTILSEPPRATVVLDGEPVGVTPWTGDISPGSHKVALELTHHRRAERAFELPPERPLDLKLALEALSGTPAPVAAPSASPMKPADAPRAPTSDPAPVERGGSVSPVTWAAFGVGALAFGGAIGFEVARSKAETDAADAPTQIEARDRYDAMERRQTTARILVGVGTLATVAGGVLLYFDLTRKDSAALRAGFACSGDRCTLGGAGRF